MALRFTVKGVGVTGQSTEFANVVLRAGVCTGGVAGTVYEFDPGQDSQPTLGYGPLAVADCRAAALVPNAQRYALKVAATQAGTISTVTQSGSGPLITVAGETIDGISDSPFIAANVKVRVAKGGPLGTARVDIALDGARFNYTLDVPAQGPPTVIGTVDVTGFTWGSGGTLDGLTFIIGAATCTFADPADEADMLAQLETAIAGYSFDLVQGKYLRVRKDTAGGASTFTINATSTSDGTLGVSNTAATGSDSSITIPGTGFPITFPTGTYVEKEIYSFTTTAPRTSLAALMAALTTAGNDFTIDFGLDMFAQAPLDEVDARAYTDALDALHATWETQTDKRFAFWLANTPLDVSDTAIKLAYATSTASRHGAMAHQDCWLPSVLPQPIGNLRTPLVEQLAIRCASYSFSEDPGCGEFGPLECSLAAPAGTPLARNEATASIKMGTSTGPGFTTLGSKRGKPYFTRGVTRAGSTGPLSRFVDVGVARATKAISAVIWMALGKFENKTFALNADGTMLEGDASAIDTAFNTECRGKFVPDHFSSFKSRVVRAEKVSETRNFTVRWTAQIRGQGEDVTGELSIVGTVEVQ